MGATESRRAHAPRQKSNRLKLSHSIATNSHLRIERKAIGPTARKSAHDALKRSLAAPTIVRLARGAIKTERHMGQGFPMLDQERPDAFEMPAVGNTVAFQIQRRDCGKEFPELRMKRWLATSEHHLFDPHRVARVPRS